MKRSNFTKLITILLVLTLLISVTACKETTTDAPDQSVADTTDATDVTDTTEITEPESAEPITLKMITNIKIASSKYKCFPCWLV